MPVWWYDQMCGNKIGRFHVEKYFDNDKILNYFLFSSRKNNKGINCLRVADKLAAKIWERICQTQFSVRSAAENRILQICSISTANLESDDVPQRFNLRNVRSMQNDIKSIVSICRSNFAAYLLAFCLLALKKDQTRIYADMNALLHEYMFPRT